MKSSVWLKPPTFFVSFSFIVGMLNFLDTFARRAYPAVTSTAYPLGTYLKPVFFAAQAAILIIFIRNIRTTQSQQISDLGLSRFFNAQTVLTVLAILLYIDFQLSAIPKMSIADISSQLAFYLTYLIVLSGTSFWFALRLLERNRRIWPSTVFFLVAMAFATAPLEPMFFWSQNYVGLAFPSQLALVGTYAPHALMFLAAMSTIVMILQKASKSSLWLRFAPLLFIPAFVVPFVWNGYKEGLINFIIRDIFYWSLGYSGYEWYSVSFYLMAFTAYVLTWKELSRRSEQAVAFSLIVLGVVSFPWNGVILLRVGYSSIPGNIISLDSMIIGVSLLDGKGVR